MNIPQITPAMLEAAIERTKRAAIANNPLAKFMRTVKNG